jgi:hypothetical protein
MENIIHKISNYTESDKINLKNIDLPKKYYNIKQSINLSTNLPTKVKIYGNERKFLKCKKISNIETNVLNSNLKIRFKSGNIICNI